MSLYRNLIKVLLRSSKMKALKCPMPITNRLMKTNSPMEVNAKTKFIETRHICKRESLESWSTVVMENVRRTPCLDAKRIHFSVVSIAHAEESFAENTLMPVSVSIVPSNGTSHLDSKSSQLLLSLQSYGHQ